MRVALPLLRPPRPSAPKTARARFDRSARDLERRAGRVRDLDVTIDLWDRDPRAGRARPGRAVVQAALRARRRARWRSLLRSFEGTPAQTARRQLEALAPHLTDPVLRSGARYGVELERARAALRAAYVRARNRPSPRRLHRLRIRLRDFRYLDSFAGAATPVGRTSGLALQKALGRLHDLKIAEGIATRVGAAEWAGDLRRRRKRRERRLSVELRRHRWILGRPRSRGP